MVSRFYFATCQVGAERAVKAEVASAYPELRFAFSRPGFVTFKEDVPEAAQGGKSAPPSNPTLALRGGVFTRLWGEVLGQTRDPATLPDLLALIPKGAIVHCFDRDQCIPGDESEGFARDAGIRAALRNVAESDPGSIALPLGEAPREPVPGEAVYSLIWVDDFHVFLGRHTHGGRLLPSPGNVPEIALPAESPSRAYLKIEEAFLRFTPKIERGIVVLEVGCAPGGATTAMLNHGLVVTGIDPQPMDARVYARTGFTHVRKPARYATADDLRDCNPDWIVMDMSIPPADALAELSHVVGLLRDLHGPSLRVREGFLTIKLNDWKYASEIPAYLRRLERIGFRGLVPTQLASNRQEFFVHASSFVGPKEAQMPIDPEGTRVNARQGGVNRPEGKVSAGRTGSPRREARGGDARRADTAGAARRRNGPKPARDDGIAGATPTAPRARGAENRPPRERREKRR